MPCHDLKPGETMRLHAGPRSGVTATVTEVSGEGESMYVSGYCAALGGRFVRWSASVVTRVREGAK